MDELSERSVLAIELLLGSSLNKMQLEMATSRLVFAWPMVLKGSAKCNGKIFVSRKTRKDKRDMYNCTMKLRKNRESIV